MEFVSHIGDVVLLENDERYLVISQVEYENDPYVLICKVQDFSELEQNIEIEYKFAKELVRENNYSLVLVDDEKTISNLFNKIKI